MVQHSKKQTLAWRFLQANLTRMTKVRREVRAKSNGVICTKINSQRWEKPQVLADCLFCRSNNLDFTSLLQLLLYLLRPLLQNSDASPLVAITFSHLFKLFSIMKVIKFRLYHLG